MLLNDSVGHSHLLNLTPAIVVDAHELPGAFHRDPVDRLLVATARFGKPELDDYRYEDFRVSPCRNLEKR